MEEGSLGSSEDDDNIDNNEDNNDDNDDRMNKGRLRGDAVGDDKDENSGQDEGEKKTFEDDELEKEGNEINNIDVLKRKPEKKDSEIEDDEYPCTSAA